MVTDRRYEALVAEANRLDNSARSDIERVERDLTVVADFHEGRLAALLHTRALRGLPRPVTREARRLSRLLARALAAQVRAGEVPPSDRRLTGLDELAQMLRDAQVALDRVTGLLG
jgi:hypothetical protein